MFCHFQAWVGRDPLACASSKYSLRQEVAKKTHRPQMCVGRIHAAENVNMSFACRKSWYLTTLSNAQTRSTHTHAQRLVWRHSANAGEAVLWKQRAVCFAGSEQGQRIWALTLINLSVVNPEHPDDSCQRTPESLVNTGGCNNENDERTNLRPLYATIRWCFSYWTNHICKCPKFWIYLLQTNVMYVVYCLAC